MKTTFKISLLVIFLMQIIIFNISAQEKEKGKLDQFEKEVEKKSNSISNQSSETNNNYISDDENYIDDDCVDEEEYEDDEYNEEATYDTNTAEGLIIIVGMAYFTTKATLNLVFVTPKEIDNGYWKIGYSDYPYSTSSLGLFNKNSGKKYSVYSSMNYFRESSTINAVSFNARLSPTPVISFEINYSDFTEKLTTRYDHLRIYDIFLNYNRVKLDNFALWWGLGIKGIMGDNSNKAIALNFGANVYFPNAPVSLSINYNIGYYDANNVHDFSPKIRYHIERAEISLGYRKFTAGQVSINGWTMGVGFYL